MRLFTLLLSATFISAPALAMDEFGSRFGNNSPYALDNDLDSALEDVAGFDIDDLNDISPASGNGDDEHAHDDASDHDSEEDVHDDEADEQDAEDDHDDEDHDHDDDEEDESAE